MAKAKANNSQTSRKAATLRGGFLQANAGANQHRSTIPLKGGMNNPLVKDAINAIYYNDNGQTMKQNIGQYLMNQAQSHPKYGPVIAGAKMVNSMLPPGVKITDQTIPNAMKAFKGNPMKSGEPNVMNSSYGLSKAPNPKPVMLNSGIAPNCYASDTMNTATNLCSPLHMSCVTLGIPTAAQNDLSNYFTNTICFDIQSRAQANVNFALDITTILSTANMVAAFNAAIAALQVYYYYASILSYESDARNKNQGMTELRKGMSAQLISDLSQLGKRLEDTPIPPRIVQWVRYLSMNYLSGDTQGAPIIKIGFDPTVMDTFTSPTPVAVALANLTTATNTNVFTLLRRAIPQWRCGTLYDVPSIPVYDKNFLSIWANLGSAHYSAAQFVYSGSVTASTEAISYNSFHNKLDGVAYAMGQTYNTTNSTAKPGLAVPAATTTKWSRRSYYSVANAFGTWENAVSHPFLAQSRIESYQYLAPAATAVTTHLFSEKCLGVSANAMNQTAMNVLDFLFNIAGIPVNGKLSSFNKTGKPVGQ